MPGRGVARRGRPPVTVGAAAALAGIGLLAACSSAVPVDPASHATDPDCAALVLATPDSLAAGLGRRHTTAQATTAWGDPAIVLRCGVEPPGPTTTRCETVATPDGPSVDWLVVQDGTTPDDDGQTVGPAAPAPAASQPPTDWTFTTYGRVPAVEVHVPAAVAASRSTDFLDALGPAIAAHTTQERSCL